VPECIVIVHLKYALCSPSDCVFLFAAPSAWPPILHKFSARDQLMADSFGAYWTNFVKSGNPNVPSTNQPHWPVYEPTQLQSIALDVPPTVVEGLLEKYCEMWDEVVQWAPPLPTKRPATKAEPKIATE
jgi:carboxylesterase type B